MKQGVTSVSRIRANDADIGKARKPVSYVAFVRVILPYDKIDKTTEKAKSIAKTILF